MMLDQLIILDPQDRTLFNEIMLKLRRIDTELYRLITSGHTKHRTHAESVLRFAFSDLNAIETKALLVKDRRLRLEIRKQILKRRQRFYETYDEVKATILLIRSTEESA
jgi:hypothetical protein